MKTKREFCNKGSVAKKKTATKPSWKIYIFLQKDEDEKRSSAIKPVLPKNATKPLLQKNLCNKTSVSETFCNKTYVAMMEGADAPDLTACEPADLLKRSVGGRVAVPNINTHCNYTLLV